MNHPSRLTGPDEAGQRLDRFLSSWLTQFSRVRLQMFIKSEYVLVNGAPARPSHIMRPGDYVEVNLPEESTPSPLIAQDIPLNILYEDSAFLILNKPNGMVVHPGAGNRQGTIANAILHHCSEIRLIGGQDRPGIVHRLDKETSGCLLIAKTESAHCSISEQFATRHVDKTYLALVEGSPRMPHGKIEARIGRHAIHRQKMTISERGRDALTKYRILAASEGKALLECHPLTGRTHQIRLHLKHLGHPIVGDPLYGRRSTYSRHFLHAWKIAFKHPDTGKNIHFTAPIPTDFPTWAIAAATAQ